MSDGADVCVVMTTVGSPEEAQRMARALVEARLAACVQRVRIDSCYEWEGVLEDAGEVLLLIKTRADRYPELEAWIAANHPYDLPEVMMLPAGQASTKYRAWVEDRTQPAG